MSFRLLLFACVVGVLGAQDALAFSVCGEEPTANREVEATGSEDLADNGAGRVILPCFLAEVGSWCAEASFYVVTPSGVLLCQHELPALVAAAGRPQVEQAPANPSASSSLSAVAIPVGEPSVPTAPYRELPALRPRREGKATDGFAARCVPPS